MQMRRASLPLWVAVPTLVGLVFLIVPFIGTLGRISWAELPALLATPESRDAIWLSLKTCGASVFLCVVIGVPLAFFLARGQTGNGLSSVIVSVARILVTLPMVLPPVVAGLALLLTFGRRGLLGSSLQLWGIEIGFTTLAVILAQTFVALPFLVISLEGALRSRGDELENVARSLGASNTRIFFSISLPLIGPALISATALALARCLGEFGATITFAGSMQGITQTLPLAIYLQREDETSLALALALVLIVLAIMVLGIAVIIDRLWQHWLYPLQQRQSDPETFNTNFAVQPLESVSIHKQQKGSAISVKAAVWPRNVEIDLDILSGETMALVGPNGSGKSTIIGLISGTLKPSVGSVIFHTKTKQQVALLSQRAMLFPHMSVLNNVIFGLRSQGVGRVEAQQRALDELREVGALELANKRPGHLSGGQAQRIALARALAEAPDILLLDEPMAALDIQVVAQFRLLLRQRLRVHRMTVVIITHDADDLAALADRIAVIEKGRVQAVVTWDSGNLKPPTSFFAGLCGINALEGRVQNKNFIPNADSKVAFPVPNCLDGPALLLFHPLDAEISQCDTQETHLQATVIGIEKSRENGKIKLMLVSGEQCTLQLANSDSAMQTPLEYGQLCCFALKQFQIQSI